MHKERGPETIETVVKMFAGHAVNHFRQIEQILASREIGPATSANSLSQCDSGRCLIRLGLGLIGQWQSQKRWQPRGNLGSAKQLWLLPKDQRRSDARCPEVDSDVHTVGNCYEMNTATQPKIPAVDRQYPFDLAGGAPCLSINGEG